MDRGGALVMGAAAGMPWGGVVALAATRALPVTGLIVATGAAVTLSITVGLCWLVRRLGDHLAGWESGAVTAMRASARAETGQAAPPRDMFAR